MINCDQKKNAVLNKNVQDMASYIMHNTATFGCTVMQNLLFNITKITTSFFSVHNIMVSNFQRDQCLLLSFF